MNNLLHEINNYLDNNDLPLLPIGGLLLVIGLALAIAMPQTDSAPTVNDAVYIIATPTAQAVAQPVAPTAPVLPRAVVAYAAPGGVTLGAIEAGRPYTYLARSGAEWVLLDVVGSGHVWVQSAALLGVAAGLPDVATPTPAPQPQIVVVQAPTPAPQVVYQAQSAPPAPTAEMVHWSELPQFVTPPDYPQPTPWYTPQPLPTPELPTPVLSPADGWGAIGGGSGGSWGD